MKIKPGKKILSIALAVLMVITSIPFVAFSALVDTSTDTKVIAVSNAMQNFEAKLNTPNMFTNVKPAYDAYVECQKALDAYIYGLESTALDGKADALNAAVNNIGTFTPFEGTAVPTFANSSESDMKGYAGTAYKNVLYAPQATQLIKSDAKGGIHHMLHYSNGAVLLYDGVNDTRLPVMVSAIATASSAGYNKTRYIYSCYPSDASGNDDANWELVDQWNSGADGANANWNWNWWSGTSNGVNLHAGYNHATGYLGNATADRRSDQIPGCNRSGFISYTYSESEPRFMANALKLKTAPTQIQSTYNLTWYTMTGADPNSANDIGIQGVSAPIYVINYKALTDAVTANGSKMKDIDLEQYTEGGLADYFTAMDNATSLNPNTYFESGNNVTGCANAIQTAINDMNNAPTDVTNSADYDALRSAMKAEVYSTYEHGNADNVYTAEIWSRFEAAVNGATAIMGAVNENGYTDGANAAAAATELTEAYNALETSVTKVDVSALKAAINTFERFNKDFFVEYTYTAVTEAIVVAKTNVWGNASNYGVAANLPDDSPESQALVATELERVNNAIKELRIGVNCVVPTNGYGRYSLDAALALESKVVPENYSNAANFTKAISDAKLYAFNIKDKEFDASKYNDLMAEYQSYVTAIAKAYTELQISFTLLPDNTVAQAKMSSIATLHQTKNGGEHWIDFSYPSSAIILKTTHDSGKVAYGTTNTTFKINIDTNISKPSNSLDSITIDGTADENKEITSRNTNEEPGALNDQQRATYSACLEKGNFSLANFRLTEIVNNRRTVYGIREDGGEVTDLAPADDAYKAIVGNSTGQGVSPVRGAIITQPKNKGDSYFTLTSDMIYDVTASPAAELTADTIPTKTTVTHSGYFGALYTWNTQPTLAYAGYAYMTSKANNELVNSTVDVIDISYLFDLIKLSEAKAKNGSIYTTETFDPFSKALSEAKAQLDYQSLDPTIILTKVVKRYQDLWTAYNNLKIKDVTVTFKYKTADGVDTSTDFVTQCTGTLEAYADQINAINPPSYKADGFVYTFKEWSPKLDVTAPVGEDEVFVATYTSVRDKADWAYYNEQLAALKNALSVTGTTRVVKSDAENIAATLETLDYYKLYTAGTTDTVMSDQQEQLNAEADVIKGLIPTTIDVSAALASTYNDDIDQYDSTKIEALKAGLNATVDVLGITVPVVDYATQQELDDAVKAALNSIMTYNIYINDALVGQDVPYGTNLTFSGDGTTTANGTTYTWFGYIAAPSYGESTADGHRYKGSNERHLTTGETYSFVVKGDTYLTAKNTADDTADESQVVILNNVTGYVNNIVYVKNGTTLSDVLANNEKDIACYKFTGFFDKPAGGKEVTADTVVNNDMVIYACYATEKMDSYIIAAFDSSEGFANGTDVIIADPADPYTGVAHNYNDVVTVTSANANFYAWAKIVSMGVDSLYQAEIVSYDKTYTFNVCQEAYLFAVTKDQVAGKKITPSSSYPIDIINCAGTAFDVDTDNAQIFAKKELVPIYGKDGVTLNKVSLVGSFALPTGYKLLEKGFLIDFNNSGIAEENFNVLNNSITRAKVIHITAGGNQFVLNLVGGGKAPMAYRAYAIVEAPDGTRTEIYSNIVNAAAI